VATLLGAAADKGKSRTEALHFMKKLHEESMRRD
jgi:hypothetical protein